MITKPSDLKNVIVSGIFVFIGILVAMVFIFMLSSESALFSPKFHLYTKVQNTQNLKNGAAVQLRGIRIGTVRSINFTNVDEIVIHMRIDLKYRPWIREDSYLSVRTQGVLGDKYLEILGGSAEAAIISDQAKLEFREDSTIDQFLNKGEDILSSASSLIIQLDTALQVIDFQNINQLIESYTKAGDKLTDLLERLEKVNYQKTFSGIDSTNNEIYKLIKKINEGPGTLNSLIYDNSLHQDIQTLLGGAQRNRILNFFIRESLKGKDQK